MSHPKVHYTAVVIGCGPGGEHRGGWHSIGYAHGDAYRDHPRITLTGACDLNAENLARFRDHYQVPHVDTDLATLLAAARPDIVSVCTYAGSHRILVEAAIRSGAKAVWCEKPFALAMDDIRAMNALAETHGVKLVVNHLRRYLGIFLQVRELLRAGAIGPLQIILGGIEGWDQMEWGTHWLDMMRFFAGDQPVKWVLGQARCTGEKRGYGHVMEEHSVCYFSFADGSRGLLDGGVALPGKIALRLVGLDGMINLISDGRIVLINAEGRREIAAESSLHAPHPTVPNHTRLLLDELLAWIEGGAEPGISGRQAALSSELYLACYESAKQGDRIDLPLGSQAEFPLNAIATRQKASAPSSVSLSIS